MLSLAFFSDLTLIFTGDSLEPYNLLLIGKVSYADEPFYVEFRRTWSVAIVVRVQSSVKMTGECEIFCQIFLVSKENIPERENLFL